MIIKSMSRKAPTFAQLAAYIGRGSDPASGTVFVRNLYADGYDERVVAGQFLDNYRYLPKRKNGNALYHEVIVLEAQDHLPPDRIEAALHDLAERYCETRAPHQLAWGRVHHDTDYPHIHLMISANAVRSDKRVRMERQYFANVQKDMEAWRDANLPALNAQNVYRREEQKQTPTTTRNEGEMVRRTSSPSAKQAVFEKLQTIFERAQGKADLDGLISVAGFELYKRGKSWGVTDCGSGRRYRLKTLGLMPVCDRALQRGSVPSATPENPLTRKDEPAMDTRARDLLRERGELDAQARKLLDGFERDEDNGR